MSNSPTATKFDKAFRDVLQTAYYRGLQDKPLCYATLMERFFANFTPTVIAEVQGGVCQAAKGNIPHLAFHVLDRDDQECLAGKEHLNEAAGEGVELDFLYEAETAFNSAPYEYW